MRFSLNHHFLSLFSVQNQKFLPLYFGEIGTYKPAKSSFFYQFLQQLIVLPFDCNPKNPPHARKVCFCPKNQLSEISFPPKLAHFRDDCCTNLSCMVQLSKPTI